MMKKKWENCIKKSNASFQLVFYIMSGDLGWISLTFWDMMTQLFAVSPKFHPQTFNTSSPVWEIEPG